MVVPGGTSGMPLEQCLRTVLVVRRAGPVPQDLRGYWNHADFSQLREGGLHWGGAWGEPLQSPC